MITQPDDWAVTTADATSNQQAFMTAPGDLSEKLAAAIVNDRMRLKLRMATAEPTTPTEPDATTETPKSSWIKITDLSGFNSENYINLDMVVRIERAKDGDGVESIIFGGAVGLVGTAIYGPELMRHVLDRIKAADFSVATK